MKIDYEYGKVIVDDITYNLSNDLQYLTGADPSRAVKPYLRKSTKLSIYKQIKNERPDYYENLRKFGWFQPYINEVENTPDVVVPNEVKEVLDSVKVVEEKVDNEKASQRFEDAMNILANKIGDMSVKIDAMNTNTKLEDALIKGIVEKGKDLATEDLEKELKERLDKFIHETYGGIPKRIEIVKEDVKYDKTGIFHKDFEKVLKLVNLNLPVMLTGGAGAGKNFMLEQVADALNLDFYYTSTITQEYKLTGFIDGNGTYHKTEFYEAFTNGGVFMLDEIDASIPECLVILNGAIANGYFDFPVGRKQAHKDFRVVCAGNTVGLGADIVYTGRNVLDGATLDRFVLVEIDYDKNIEENLCPDESLRNFLYDVRKSVQTNKLNHIIGMRCLKYAYELLVNNFDKDFIVKSVVLKGLGKDDINVLKSSLDSGNEWYKYVK